MNKNNIHKKAPNTSDRSGIKDLTVFASFNDSYPDASVIAAFKENSKSARKHHQGIFVRQKNG